MKIFLVVLLTVLTFAIPIGIGLYSRHSTIKTAKKINPSVSSYEEAKHALNKDIAQNIANNNADNNNFCAECGASIDSGSKYCKNCGKKL